MELNTLWFILITILYTGYFILEGFDLGVGILLPFLSKNDTQRRVIINTIGPHWDGNEVWLITAGGATFAAFPQWYATLFSGFYLPLFLILIALIFRGAAFEFRSKDDNPLWRSLWDAAICLGSFIPAFLWGVAFTNMGMGIPIDSSMNYIGGFWNLLNPLALLGGVISVLLFSLHGSIFISLKTTGLIEEKAVKTAIQLWLPALVSLIIMFAASGISKTTTHNFFDIPLILLLISVLLLLSVGWLVRKKASGKAFIFTSLVILLTSVTYFLQVFPNVLISSIDPVYNLTIYNASSSPYTLKIMTIISLFFVPVVLLYQGWSYWIFRKRITQESDSLEY